MDTEPIIIKRTTYEGTHYTAHLPFVLNMQAELATKFVERWGMVMIEVDGEDSRGCQKVRLMSPEEIAHRACDTADLLLEEFINRKWIVEIPLPTYEKEEAQFARMNNPQSTSSQTEETKE